MTGRTELELADWRRRVAQLYGGYTVPVSSLRPGDEAEIANKLHRDG